MECKLNGTARLLRVPRIVCASALVLLAVAAPRSSGQPVADDSGSGTRASTLVFDSLRDLDIQGIGEPGAEPVKIQQEVTSYRGRRAVRIVNIEGKGAQTGEQVLAIVESSAFKDGTIEADVAGIPREGAKPDTRGFVGIAFRVQGHGSRFEAFYLRMTNGRAGNQLQRNHSTQYVSHPDFPWRRLRNESPGIYESYVDLNAGAWIKIKIVVSGNQAQLYVNGADQPCLVVNDLKLGDAGGQVALWIGSDTDAYFSKLTIR